MSPVEFHPPDATPDPKYFTVAEARKVKPLDNATLYPDADIEAMRVAVEDALEQACGIAFVTRDGQWTADGNGQTDLLLPFPRPSVVTACTVNGVALDAGELSSLVLYRDGRVYRAGRWPAGRGNVDITVQHGWLAVPGRVKRAAILGTKRFLVDSPISDRATSLTNDDGTVSFFVTAGVRDAIFDVPELNAVVEQFGVNAGAG